MNKLGTELASDDCGFDKYRGTIREAEALSALAADLALGSAVGHNLISGRPAFEGVDGECGAASCEVDGTAKGAADNGAGRVAPGYLPTSRYGSGVRSAAPSAANPARAASPSLPENVLLYVPRECVLDLMVLRDAGVLVEALHDAARDLEANHA